MKVVSKLLEDIHVVSRLLRIFKLNLSPVRFRVPNSLTQVSNLRTLLHLGNCYLLPLLLLGPLVLGGHKVWLYLSAEDELKTFSIPSVKEGYRGNWLFLFFNKVVRAKEAHHISASLPFIHFDLIQLCFAKSIIVLISFNNRYVKINVDARVLFKFCQVDILIRKFSNLLQLGFHFLICQGPLIFFKDVLSFDLALKYFLVLYLLTHSFAVLYAYCKLRAHNCTS